VTECPGNQSISYSLLWCSERARGSLPIDDILLPGRCYSIHCVHKEVSPLEKRKPALIEIKFCTYNVTFIWVTKAKFYRNLSFCIRDFHSFFKVVSNTSPPLLDPWRRSPERTTDWLKSGVTLIRTLSTEQWISGVIDCVNVSVLKEDTLNMWRKQLDCFNWH